MKTFVVSCLTILGLSVAPAFADPVNVDGSWHEFLFGRAGTFATTCGGTCDVTTDPLAERTSTPPWTFSGPAGITITDLFNRGDQFALFDNSVLVGDTSTPINDAGITCPTTSVGNDIVACLADPGYSHGTFLLGSGAHSLTIEVIQNAAGNTAGAAVFQVSGVPEPSAFVPLFGVGLLGLVSLRRRMR